MSLEAFLPIAQQYFPKLQIKYKDQSLLTKIIGKIMFFNKGFMTDYVTTIGNTVYFPNQDFVKLRPVSSVVLLLHELMHVKDSQKFSRPLFSFLYLFPLSLIPFLIPLFFFWWKPALVLTVLFLLPLPAYFRMIFEKRAYMVSLYVVKSLEKRLNFTHDLIKDKDFYIDQFHTGAYYFSWPFKSINNEFEQALTKVESGNRPFEDPFFDTLDKLIAQV